MLPERYERAVAAGNGDLQKATDRVERALLGAVLLAGHVPKVPPRPEDFAAEAHRVTWGAVLAVVARGEEPELTRVAYELAAGGALERAGGDAYLAGHLDNTDCSDIQTYARLVREAARMRRLGRLRP